MGRLEGVFGTQRAVDRLGSRRSAAGRADDPVRRAAAQHVDARARDDDAGGTRAFPGSRAAPAPRRRARAPRTATSSRTSTSARRSASSAGPGRRGAAGRSSGARVGHPLRVTPMPGSTRRTTAAWRSRAERRPIGAGPDRVASLADGIEAVFVEGTRARRASARWKWTSVAAPSRGSGAVVHLIKPGPGGRFLPRAPIDAPRDRTLEIFVRADSGRRSRRASA